MRFRPSSYDNFCWGEIQAGKPLAEVNNPQLGQKGESGWYAPAALKRRPGEGRYAREKGAWSYIDLYQCAGVRPGSSSQLAEGQFRIQR